MKLVEYTWVYFCEITGTHGLHQIFVEKLTSTSRKFYIVAFFLMVALSIYEIEDSIVRYMQYEVKTSVQYKNVKEINFPSITFCNTNVLLRTVVGSSPTILMGALFMLTKDVTAATKEMDTNEKYCSSNETNPTVDEFSAYQLYNMDLSQFASLIAPSSKSSVLKCWWNDKQVEDCESMFVNQATDQGICFTFNPSKSLRHLFQQTKISNEEKYTEMSISKTGMKSGLRLLLTVDQSNYCGTFRKFVGAGFQAVIHDPRLGIPSLQVFPVNSMMQLAPGFKTDLVLKATKFQRYTENLHKCTSPKYKQNGTKVYSKTMCFTATFAVYMYTTCGCFPIWCRGHEQLIVDNSDIPLTKIRFCHEYSELICAQEVMNPDVNKLPASFAECTLDPCFETKYTYEKISTSHLSSAVVNGLLNTNSSMSENFVRKNLLLLNVFFSDLLVTVVTETQDFNEEDMIIYMGGILGLFLGMSFTTVFEIMFHVFVFVVNIVEKQQTLLRARLHRRAVACRIRKYTGSGSIDQRYLRRNNPRPSVVSLFNSIEHHQYLRRNKTRPSVVTLYV